jgi:hypothetical protein
MADPSPPPSPPFKRLSKEEFEALSREDRFEYLERAFKEIAAQIERNRKLLDSYKKRRG